MPRFATKTAQNPAHFAPDGQIDACLASVIEAWPTLPGPIKAGILAMVRAAGRSV